MTKYVSPLRYPGGKLKVVDYIEQMFEVNDLVGGTYIEPYDLVETAKTFDKMETVRKMKQIVPEYKCNNSVYEVLDT